MIVDLHAHSNRSDGTDSPREVVLEAQSRGVDVLALTDHDTAAGWDEARDAAASSGVVLVPGMEISCELGGRSVHLLAYLPDPAYPPLASAVAGVLEGREQRLPRICARLRELGIDIVVDDVAAQATGAAALGRPHVADALVEKGVVASRGEAFARYLNPGRPAYVRREAPAVEDLLGHVRAAGGVPVIAHPWGRHAAEGLQADGLARLRDRGLAGVEVDHVDHPPEAREQLRAIADELGLVRTGASDYHGQGKPGVDLGCNRTEPEQLQRLLELADASARASGRPVPTVVGDL